MLRAVSLHLRLQRWPSRIRRVCPVALRDDTARAQRKSESYALGMKFIFL